MPKKKEPVQISFEDLLGGNYHDSICKVKKLKNTPKECNPQRNHCRGGKRRNYKETVEQKLFP
jgi:hypothetical protein